MIVQHFFDKETFTLTYVVHRNDGNKAIVIDPVWNYDPASSSLNNQSLYEVKKYLDQKNLIPELIIETHAHADHVTAAQQYKNIYPNLKVAIGKNICRVQETFAKVFNLGSWFKRDGSQFDILLDENTKYSFANIEFEVIFTPGHTPACSSILIGNNLFTGDALFMPDSGTGRCDFPGGSAKELFNSIKNKIYQLDDSFKIWVGHDYQPNGRELKCQSTIGEQKRTNIQLTEKTEEAAYLEFRTTRDKSLSAPRLLLPSIQINIDAGHLPPKEKENHISYLKLPLTIKP